MPPVTASTVQLLAWIAERPRSYAATMEAWKTSCPRRAVWEDALADDLVRVEHGLGGIGEMASVGIHHSAGFVIVPRVSVKVGGS